MMNLVTFVYEDHGYSKLSEMTNVVYFWHKH